MNPTVPCALEATPQCPPRLLQGVCREWVSATWMRKVVQIYRIKTERWSRVRDQIAAASGGSVAGLFFKCRRRITHRWGSDCYVARAQKGRGMSTGRPTYGRSSIQPLELSQRELRWWGMAIGFCAICHLASQILSFLTLLKKKRSSDGLGRGSDFRSREFQDSGERRPTSLAPDIFQF
jgi:hypothetical protein